MSASSGPSDEPTTPGGTRGGWADLHAVVEHSPAVLAVTDAAAVVTYLTPSIERLTGFPPRHYLGRGLGEHLHGEDPLADLLARSWRDPGAVVAATGRLERWDGSYLWVESTCTNLLDDPTVGGLVVHLHDITTQVRAQQAVEASEARYRAIVEATHDAIVVIDRSGVVSFANARAHQLFAVRSGSLIARDLDEVVPDPDARAAFLGVADPDEPARRPEVALAVGGERRWVSVAADPLRRADGAVVGTLALVSDVTARHHAEERLRLHARMLESVGEAVFAVDGSGRFTFWNRAAEQVLGHRRADVLGRHALSIAPRRARSRLASVFQRYQPGGSWSGEVDMVRASGERFPALVRTSPVLAPDGAVEGVVGVVVDVTREREAADELVVHAGRQSVLAELGADALAAADLDGLLDLVLGTAASQLGVACGAYFDGDGDGRLVLRRATGLSPELVGRALDAGPDGLLGRALGGARPLVVESIDRERLPLAPDLDDRRHQLRSGVLVAVDGADGARGLLAVGDREPRAYPRGEVDFVRSLGHVLGAAASRLATEAHLEHLALHDPLTGLANRVQLDRRLAVGDGDAAALVLVDLDSLRLVNDVMGHEAGDAVLVEAGRRLVGAADAHALVARVGGDEFAVLLEPVGAADLRAVVERVCGALAEPVVVDGTEVVVTASAGLAVAAADGGAATSRASLLRHADLALKEAKARGRGGAATFDPALLDEAAGRLAMTSALRGAPDRGELELRYQPEIDLRSGAVGVEALLRWHHPELGQVTPDRFIPLAEESGAIVEIGAWVLVEACRQLRAWRDRDEASEAGEAIAPQLVAVNLSPRQLVDARLLDTVRHALAEADLEPRALVLEITETAVLADPETSLRAVQDLVELGVRVAVDDFGTGYSSLEVLQRLPVSALKVDRSFVAGLTAAGSERGIVAAVIALAHNLGAVAVAEGVETEQQAQLLRGLGCDVGQGFLWARPLPPDDLVVWLGQWAERGPGPPPAGPPAR